MKKTILFLLSMVFLSACSQSATDNLQLQPAANGVPGSDVNVVPGSDVNVPAGTLKDPVVVPGSGFNVPAGTLKDPVVVPGSNPDVLEQKDDSVGAKP